MCNIKYLLEWMKAIHPCLSSRFPDPLHLQTAQPGAARPRLRARSRLTGSSAAAQGPRGRAALAGAAPATRGALGASALPPALFCFKTTGFWSKRQRPGASILPQRPPAPGWDVPPLARLAPVAKSGVPRQLLRSQGWTPASPVPPPPPRARPAPAAAPAASAASRSPSH